MTWMLAMAALAAPVAAGAGHTCHAVGGMAFCWGGQTPEAARRGDPPPKPLPYAVDGVRTAARLDAGGSTRTCAVTEDGGVQCWSLTAPAAPIALPGPATDVSVGDRHACAVLADGGVWCWGGNNRGQLGDGSTTDRDTPVSTGITDAVHADAGWVHTCAVRRSGRVSCWGDRAHGQVGDGEIGEPTLVPTPVLYVEDAVQVHTGTFHTCVLRVGGGVACWGSNRSGQLGDGTRTSAPVVTGIPDLTDAVGLCAGMDHACALRAGGKAACWGSNERGQLAQPDGNDGLFPRVVDSPTLTALSCGGQHTCATDLRGRPWCWGQNFSGQLGDGTRTTRRTPALVDLAP